MVLKGVAPLEARGNEESSELPLPSWPELFRPQHQASPVPDAIAQECAAPVAMLTNGTSAFTFVGTL